MFTASTAATAEAETNVSSLGKFDREGFEFDPNLAWPRH